MRLKGCSGEDEEEAEEADKETVEADKEAVEAAEEAAGGGGGREANSSKNAISFQRQS